MATLTEISIPLPPAPPTLLVVGGGDGQLAEITPAVNPLTSWLLSTGWSIADAATLVGYFCNVMVEHGIPVCRVRVNIRMLHPQYIGTTFGWERGRDEVREIMPSHDIVEDERYLRSPYAPILNGAGGLRRRLDVDGAELDYPILEELKAEGATDYVAMPLPFSDGRMNAVTFAADRPGGFTTDELTMIYDTLPVLARVMELHAMRRTARTILDTYLGKLSGERVLEGRMKRGDGEDIHAVIWFSDLRGSTALSEILPRADFLDLLDDYFGCMAGAVLDHGGEVLRFIGDAVLAIFPIGAVTPTPELCHLHIDACTRALDAAEDAIGRADACNGGREENGKRPMRFGIGLHLGDVMYGNIGVPHRLEFSVIGAAANEAARIEAMTKALYRPLLVSSQFARVVPERLVSLGFHVLRGVRHPHELFTTAREQEKSR